MTPPLVNDGGGITLVLARALPSRGSQGCSVATCTAGGPTVLLVFPQASSRGQPTCGLLLILFVSQLCHGSNPALRLHSPALLMNHSLRLLISFSPPYLLFSSLSPIGEEEQESMTSEEATTGVLF